MPHLYIITVAQPGHIVHLQYFMQLSLTPFPARVYAHNWTPKNTESLETSPIKNDQVLISATTYNMQQKLQ